MYPSYKGEINLITGRKLFVVADEMAERGRGWVVWAPIFLTAQAGGIRLIGCFIGKLRIQALQRLTCIVTIVDVAERGGA